nr:MAG: ORF1 [TTV-like mini virus]
MPLYYKRYYRPRWRQFYRRRYFRTRRRPRFWRSRQTVRRRRPIWRRRYRVRKRLYKKKKLKYLFLKQFQPKKIRKCRIRGIISLFECGPNRLHREWTNFMNSFYPPNSEGGGGWSQMQFSLESLYEQYELLRNKWSASNVLMPLVRYTGCNLKLYRSNNVDYICNYSICLPMKTSKYQHTNAQPSNMLLYPKHIIVPSLQRKPKGKLYVKKKIKLPEQFENKWYFQSDLYKQPLLLLTTSACNLDRWYLNPRSISNNITIITLNTDFIQSHNFRQYGLGTNFWGPQNNLYLYGLENGSAQTKVQELIFLGQTLRDTPGKPINTDPTTPNKWQSYSQKQKQRDNFGNIFHMDYLQGRKTVYSSQLPPQEIFKDVNLTKPITEETLKLTEVTQDIYKECRYNPERDKGFNKIWLVNTSDIIYGWHEPEEEDLKYEGFPLWALLWGYVDWHIKYKKYNKIEENYILVAKTPYIWPEYNIIVPLNQTFINGYSNWQDETHEQFISDKEDWHPKLKFQDRQIENICQTGPGTAKTSATSIEAHCLYSFYFKWGGCPNELENITDPGKQTHYPVPNTELQTPEIEDPITDPKRQIWPWDVRRHMLTKKGAKRIKETKELKVPSFTGSKLSATTTDIETIQKIPTQISSQTSEEEKETSQLQQLNHLKHNNNKLRLQLTKLLSQTVNLKF